MRARRRSPSSSSRTTSAMSTSSSAATAAARSGRTGSGATTSPRPSSRAIEPGDELPGGLVALYDGRGRVETPLWLPEQRAIVFADGMTAPEGELRVWATPWHEERVLPALRALLELPFEHVIVSHGAPSRPRGLRAGARAAAVRRCDALGRDLGRRPLAAGVAGVRRPERLDEQDVRLLVRLRAVLDAARHDEQLARAELDVTIAELNRQSPREDEEEVVGVGMGVPDELALHLDELELVVVQLPDDPRAKCSSNVASFAARSTFSSTASTVPSRRGPRRTRRDRAGVRVCAVTTEPSVTRELETTLEGIDNPIERLKLLAGNDEEIARYLDTIEVTSPREREMLQEIARTQRSPPRRFPQAHRNMVEALESLARHGFHGSPRGDERRPTPVRRPLGRPARRTVRRRLARPERLHAAPKPLHPP